MKDAITKLKEAVEAKAAATKHEGIMWQKLAEALEAFSLEPQYNPVAVSEKTGKKYPQTYLTNKQAAEYLGVAHQTLNKWRVQGGGPLFHKIGGSIRYKVEDLEKFAGQNAYPHTSAYDSKK